MIKLFTSIINTVSLLLHDTSYNKSCIVSSISTFFLQWPGKDNPTLVKRFQEWGMLFDQVQYASFDLTRYDKHQISMRYWMSGSLECRAIGSRNRVWLPAFTSFLSFVVKIYVMRPIMLSDMTSFIYAIRPAVHFDLSTHIYAPRPSTGSKRQVRE